MTEPNLEQRITAAADAYSAIMWEALELVWSRDDEQFNEIARLEREIRDSDAAVQNTAAVLRDYFRRPEGE